MVLFVLRNSQLKFYAKIYHFFAFCSYTKIISSISDQIISQQASYVAQQSLIFKNGVISDNRRKTFKIVLI